MARLFISHSSENNVAALALATWLSEIGFDDCFLDIDPNRGLVAGDRWNEALKAAADRCQGILFLISPAWVASKWCLAEFLMAKTLRKRVFGLVVEPVPIDRIPVEMQAEWQLSDLIGDGPQRAFEIDTPSGRTQIGFRQAGLELLRRGLERAGLEAQTFPWPPPNDPGRAPYRGLRALEPEDAAIFFGRDAAIVRALDRIRGMAADGTHPLMVVLGASGSGKSSFLRAGLLPRLRRDDLRFLTLPVIRPDVAVITGDAGLAVALAQTAERFAMPRALGRIKETIAGGADRVVEFLAELVDAAVRRLVQVDRPTADPMIVIAIDQAEELYNPEGAGEAQAFLALLAALLAAGRRQPSPRVLVLVTIRSDRYELMQSDPLFVDVKRELFDLPPIAPSEFKNVIEGPALRVAAAGVRLTIDPGLTEQLIADAEGADALPLLSFTLERLHADYGSEGRLTSAEYAALGGVQGSIEAAIAKALGEPHRPPAISAAKEDQYACLRAAFIPWLARISPDTGAPMRRVARLDEIPEASRSIAERLVGARLLVADRRGHTDVLEVAHESLLRRWPALAAWLEADAQTLKLADGVERAAAEWTRNARHEAWLDHRGDRLVVAERLMMRSDFRRRLGADGEAYLVACHARDEADRAGREAALGREQARLAEIAAAQARTARNQRVARWSLVAAAVAVVVGLALSLWQHRTNLGLQSSLGAQRAVLDRAQTNLFVELAVAERLRGNVDAALRFAVHAVRLERRRAGVSASPSGEGTLANIELSTELSLAGWQQVIGGHGRAVSSATFSPDGQRLVTASADNTARIWDVATGKPLAILAGHTRKPWTADFSPDGRQVVTAAEDGTARVWDAASGKELAVLRAHADKVTDAAFSSDGRRIVTSSFDRTAVVWDAATRTVVAVLRGHDNTVQSARFSPDGTRIVTASDDNSARVWAADTGREILRLRGHEKAVYYASFSADGKRLVTGSDDTTARLWDGATGRQTSVLRGHDDYVNRVEFSPDGRFVLTASADETARLWDAASGTQVTLLQGHEDHVNTAAFRPDGHAVVTASRDGTARIWKVVADAGGVTLRGHEGPLLAAAFSADGSRVVTAGQDKTARVWSVAGARALAVLRGHAAAVRSAVISPDGRHVLTGSEDRTARVWDTAGGDAQLVLRGHENWVMAVAYSPDGARIVTASWDKSARIWDAASGRQLFSLNHDDIVYSATFSPDGKHVLTASQDKTVRVWDAASGKQIMLLRGHDGAVNSAAYSPDGMRIVTASQDKTALVWDAASGRIVGALRGHEMAVSSAAFGPRGARLVTTSRDRTARIWDAAAFRETAVLRGHTGWLSSAAFSPDRRHVVTTSRDGTARIWEVGLAEQPEADAVTEACAHRLGPLSKLTRDDMQLAGFPADMPPIDVCAPGE